MLATGKMPLPKRKTELKAEKSLCTLLFVVFVEQWITIDRRTIRFVCATKQRERIWLPLEPMNWSAPHWPGHKVGPCDTNVVLLSILHKIIQHFSFSRIVQTYNVNKNTFDDYYISMPHNKNHLFGSGIRVAIVVGTSESIKINNGQQQQLQQKAALA